MNGPSRALATAVAALTLAAGLPQSATAQAASRAGTFAASATSPSPSAAPSTPPEVEIPSTPLGDALRWVLDAASRPPVPEEELKRRIAPEFLAQAPPETFNQVFEAFKGMRLQRLSLSHATALTALVQAGGKPYLLELSVDGRGLINGLRLTEPPEPQPAPASWAELDRRLRAVAPRVGFAAAEVTGRSCRTVHALEPGTPRPLGSMVKLYVLGAVAERVAKGGLRWDTRLTITPELKSLPTGQLQDRPDGSEVTVLEAAKLMISISDNTATDLLIHKVGRKAVERTMRAWSRTSARGNVPLLTTRELFVLKGVNYPRMAERYLSSSVAGKRAYLRKVVAKVPLSRIVPWGSPRELDTIEWFASPADICRAYARLARLEDPRVGEALSINDAGLHLPADRWSRTWFKGGSEAGVLDLGFLATTRDGRTYVVTLMASHTGAPLPDGQAGAELLALAKGAFTLAATR